MLNGFYCQIFITLVRAYAKLLLPPPVVLVIFGVILVIVISVLIDP